VAGPVGIEGAIGYRLSAIGYRLSAISYRLGLVAVSQLRLRRWLIADSR
jgi:hypothetical protein